MKIIAVATIKGGVGKTILSGHLAAGLARQGHRTLLMDLDPQGHATLLTGIDAHPEAYCVGDVLLRESRLTLEEIIVRGMRENLDVAPAVLKMAAQERQLYTWALRLKTVLRVLENMQDKPDAVVIDCPPHIGGFTEAALHAADLTLAPLPALAGSLHGLSDLRSTWTEMRDGRAGELAGVINLWDQRTSVTNASMLEMLSNVDIPVFETRVPKCEVVNQAALRQVLVYDHAPNHQVAKVFDALAAEAWERVSQVVDKRAAQEDVAEEPDWYAEQVAASNGWHVPAEAMLGADSYSIVQE